MMIVKKAFLSSDVTILSIMDTFTSILGGFTIFAILGNLAHNIDEKDVRKVVKETFGLAFISYPEAIAKIKKSLDNAWIIPQVCFYSYYFTFHLILNPS